ncbi:PH domain-containing protein [Skermania sp. ID1734]|uniref:PH domain-containing protein n=1 Tax=Skermania sp. ID1734 TaxID=2597516 RepID=UPI001180C6F4|nr:PH domain-containing protein [Skermania sp. ID1734]TSE01023.1 PH domain-containing protein [Skermania sp. ID1734]
MSSPHQPVPPEPSSHTASSATAQVQPAQRRSRYVIRISRLAWIAVVMLFFCVSLPVIAWPAAFAWLLLIPVAVGIWVARIRTTVTPDGLELRSVFGAQNLSWTQVRGVRFPKRGWARADLGDGAEVALPAVGFDRIRELAAASNGRIPDPYAE